ncbi:DUF4012 domain-containing protein [Candidatus Uhrbacteria bacterium]|nr:DUF4012 domain-containing protein [Candidatus Uhrbacteria bacterium]
MNSIRPANFLEYYDHDARPRRSRWFVLPVLLGIALFFMMSFFAVRSLVGIVEKTQRAKDHLLYSVELFQDQRFAEARTNVSAARNLLGEVGVALTPWRFTVAIPLLGRQFTALRETIAVIDRLALAFDRAIVFSDRLVTTVTGSKPLRLGEITPEQKRIFLAQLFEAAPVLHGIKADIDLALVALQKVPERFLLPPLADAVSPLKTKLPRIEHSVSAALPFLEALPLVSGYPKEQRYLFLFQNNDELRPTGGFIGTYGILRLKDGEMQSLFTDNIYRLDRLAERGKRMDVTPPPQLARHLGVTKWFLRDANWSPDFPTTARQALAFYQKESNDTTPIDGVFAVTPTVVVRLLQLLGPITIDRVTFDAENVVDTLQFHVEQGYVDAGIPDVERKEIIGKLTKEIVARLMTLPLARIPDLLDIAEGAMRERHIMVYETNPALQSIVTNEGWDGSVAQTDGDFLMLVDANLAALKTDSVMERQMTYAVTPENGRLKARVTMTYHNTGLFSWKTTRYRTYTRVYVPFGATLVGSTGFITEDKKQTAKPAEVSTELGKTVFGGFLIVEPRATKTVTLEYLLPDRIATNPYVLRIQKQAGTEANPLRVMLQFGTTPKTWQPTGFAVERKGNTLSFPTDLRVDRQFKVFF